MTPLEAGLRDRLAAAASALDALALFVAGSLPELERLERVPVAELDHCHEGWLNQADWMRRAANEMEYEE